MTLQSVLIANRGEIAVRIASTLRAMGIRSIAVYTDGDTDHLGACDTAVRLGADSSGYLDIDAIISAAKQTGAQAIHPGYGFVSENADFVRACQAAGIVFVGPPAGAMDAMGDKIRAKDTVAAAGEPVVPGSVGALSDAELVFTAEKIGAPLIIKPSAGGGGKGMRVVHDLGEISDALVASRREAAALFGDDTLLVERYLARPRHIEVQVFGDTHGNVVHLGERECSLQRRHQKVIEEAPSALLTPQLRAAMGQTACQIARSVGYFGAGTVEFILDGDAPESYYFMEMNTRLQVEHPVTEMVTGIDLVQWQILVAAGERLPLSQEQIVLTGHAVEARVYAEDPAREFLPTGGTVALARFSGTARTDTALATGSVVGSRFDPMLAKVIVHAADRDTALAEVDRALGETRILGVGTNIDFLRVLVTNPVVMSGDIDTSLLDKIAAEYHPPVAPPWVWVAASALLDGKSGAGTLWDGKSGWRVGAHAPRAHRLRIGDSTELVRFWGDPVTEVSIGEGDRTPSRVRCATAQVSVEFAGQLHRADAVRSDAAAWVATEDGTWHADIAPEPRLRHLDGDEEDGEIRSSMPGVVRVVSVSTGTAVEREAVVVVVEAMKMEHTLRAPIAGTVTVSVAVGDQVAVDQLLATIHPNTNPEEGKP
ncbi:acetyl/propionyl/methylcrotonyl-CoA carboxylase subunit alpha [Mycobacteroides abscessus]|uniref:acetyl/propionyl/methylcrotonyl-CoA carboxylase subunit alpha n=1 Tax=Mycobacteroides abscessus TaxID=36809 RepID=UPI0009A696FB|nr:biotin carboxylase N-terminal domain-containing protein [Mycobacteroides abscessus]MDO3070580.1 biotin carboxylase N-terminal domain-containing protein [Mycobacteroides abscessus subsp. bolletii]SKN74728.1 acetyl/propionyl-CoA carboxylase [Mycobacteroides abscessus subsp. bolletii]SKW87283.1 acetyl/propionyl-CoA carboxylase [Mycobacteroides abscessus subsp. bolletii]